MSAFKFNLGDRVQDRITKFEGIVMARSQHWNMCNRYAIEPERVGQDGKMLDSWSIDENNLILLQANVHPPIPGQRDDPSRPETAEPVNPELTGGPRERVTRPIKETNS